MSLCGEAGKEVDQALLGSEYISTEVRRASFSVCPGGRKRRSIAAGGGWEVGG